MELRVPFTGLAKVFTSSRPPTTISSVRKNGGYRKTSPSASSVPSVSSAFYECSVCHGLAPDLETLLNHDCAMYANGKLYLSKNKICICKFIDRICRQKIFIKTFISVKIAPRIGCNGRQDRNVIVI